MEQAEWDPDVDGQSSTLRNPGMDISSSTPGPYSQEAASSSSGLRPIEPSSGMGGNRVDSMVVPGGRVESGFIQKIIVMTAGSRRLDRGLIYTYGVIHP